MIKSACVGLQSFNRCWARGQRAVCSVCTSVLWKCPCPWALSYFTKCFWEEKNSLCLSKAGCLWPKVQKSLWRRGGKQADCACSLGFGPSLPSVAVHRPNKESLCKRWHMCYRRVWFSCKVLKLSEFTSRIVFCEWQRQRKKNQPCSVSIMESRRVCRQRACMRDFSICWSVFALLWLVSLFLWQPPFDTSSV